MNARTARVVSASTLGIYFALLVPGLYIQWRTGEILYAGETVSMPVFIIGGVVLAAWVALGVLIVWHSPGNPVGWIMCLWPVGYALDHFSWGYYLISLETNSASGPARLAALIWQNWSDYPIDFVLFSLFFLLFPTGRPFSPFWRRVTWIGVLVSSGYYFLEILKPGPIYSSGLYYEQLVNPIGLSETVWRYLQPLYTMFLVASVAFLGFAVFSLILRLKRSRGEERQQVKWFVYFVVVFLVLTIAIYISETIAYTGVWYRVLTTLVVAIILGMAVSIAIAIFRYRLYAIDLIIRRTLLYGGLTLALGVLYFISVTLAQGFFVAITGQESKAAIVLSTLAIAALFTPLRHRIQSAIDRRFYRGKYDAEKALADFSIQVRHEVDIEKLSRELLNIVDDTFQPDNSFLWLLESGQDFRSG
jgi:hypothetical protein